MIEGTDLTGMRFGRWLVIRKAPAEICTGTRKRGMWECVCDCGTKKVVRGNSLLCGDSTSCGCYAKEVLSDTKRKHGGFGTRLYAIWDSMRQRCYNERQQSYHNYGGRGIKVCKEWDDYMVFRSWALSTGYNENAARNECTLDRIDVDGDYCPANCRWVNMKEQSRNRRDTLRFEYLGEVHTLTEWAEIVGVKYQTIWRRYKRGLTPDRILSA